LLALAIAVIRHYLVQYDRQYSWSVGLGSLSCGATALVGLDRLTVEVSRSNTVRHNQPLGLLSQGLLPTQHIKQETDNHALSGIRNRDPSNQTTADLRFRMHRQQDGHGLD